MDQTEILIIGAGVVGLAISEKLSALGKTVIVVEKNDGFGRETSSRNSEVIHAGLYYPKESLKSLLCIDGNKKLYNYCKAHNIPFKNTSKLIVACNNIESNKVNDVYNSALNNGLSNVRMLTSKQVAELEPMIKANEALFSPTTGIIDSHSLMKCFESETERNNGIIAYNCEVINITKTNGCYIAEILDTDGKITKISSEIIINSAGFFADKIAKMVGIDISQNEYEIYFCKGEYFRISNKYKGILKHLVYPPPTNISLGIHSVIGLDGSIRLGPNAFYVDNIDYSVNNSHKKEFYEGIKSYLPFIKFEDIEPDQSGIRPKLQPRISNKFYDFVIKEESSNGFSGFINLIGIESPGLTACISIAEKIVNII